VAYVALRDEVEHSADPEGAALVLERIANARPDLPERLLADPALRAALVAVSATSPWLARVCVTDPDALDVLSTLDRRVDLDEIAGPDGEGLGRAKRLEVLRIAARDLLSLDGFEEVGAALSALASDVLDAAVRSTAGKSDGIAIVALGKLGGSELNYSSDVDVVLVAPGDGSDEALEPEVRPLLELVRSAWRVDLDLRPEGRAGPLIRTLPSYIAYWDRWAQTWEFQALLKARTVAGDRSLGSRFEDEARSRVWGRPFGAEELAQVRRMKARAEEAVSRRGLEHRELKRGRGGIRDIEFAVQLLQLVHGRADPTLRSASTLGSLRALSAGGYIGADDASSLEAAYVFLRTVEHRLQLYEDQQVHTLPSVGRAQTRLARAAGYRDAPASTALSQFERDLRRHQATVRAIHERLFFRPLLESFTSGPATGIQPAERAPGRRGSGGQGPPLPDRSAQPTLTSEAASERLAAFGFTDAARTRQAVIELTKGFSRSSKLMQQTLPVLLDWLSQSPSPDMGLLGFRTLATERHSRDQLRALCRESAEGARQLCALLGTGARFARDLQRHPDLLIAMSTGEFLPLPSRTELDRRAEQSLTWRSGERAVEAGLRLFGRAEMLRIAARDVLELGDVDETGASLSALAEAVITTALLRVSPELPFAVIGMGRLGGRELAYSSDLDLLFVYERPPGMSEPDAAAAAETAAGAVIRLIGGSTPATGLYAVDMDLRPEGRQGPLARSLDAYSAYYERWAQVWERQALLRGRVVAGDALLGERFADLAHKFVWDRPLSTDEVRDIRRTKARMERERVPPSEDPKFHLKLGAGSLSDIEWTAQLLQLENGVQEAGTLAALDMLRSMEAIDPGDARTLTEAYRFCEKTRNRLGLIRDIPSDSLPNAGPTLTALARSLGTTASALRNDYRRHTRRARRVVERVFFGGVT
jgi:[glutamine synthetase] adenylyltransferase / [glutamine synthetase]-adenylyl-L-tyrosine phosphorylase